MEYSRAQYSEPYSVSCLIDKTETPTRVKKLTMWWPDCIQDLSCHNAKNWLQRNGNKCTLELKIQFSRSVVSDSLWPHGLQHARLPCPSPTSGAYSDSCPLSWGCHPTISSPTVPFSSCLQSCTASESFPMSQLFARGGQSTGVSALASFLPKKSQGWSSEWTGWISLQVQGTLKSLLQHHSSKASILQRSAFFTVQLTWPLEKLYYPALFDGHHHLESSDLPYLEQVGSLSTEEAARIRKHTHLTYKGGCWYFWGGVQIFPLRKLPRMFEKTYLCPFSCFPLVFLWFL